MSGLAVDGADLDLVELALTFPDLRLAGPSGTITDPEGTPVAELSADGAAAPLRPLAARPELGATAAPVPGSVRATSAVVFDALPTRAQIAAVDALVGGPVAWIALTGRARRGTSAAALVGAVAAAAAAWSRRTGRAAPVSALPWSLDAEPRLLGAPPELRTADSMARWLTSTLDLAEAVVLGEGEEHRVLAALVGDAEAAARALFTPEVLPHHRGERSGGVVVLLTGLSGSGKSTIARALAAALTAGGSTVNLLDGDEVRRLLSAGLGFDAEGRATNIRRIGWVAAQIARAGGIAIAAPIAPFAAGRAEMRRTALEAGARFVLVHVSTPIEVCEARDRKGLYAAARAGRIPEFTGISSPYEPPSDADATIDTTTTGVEEAVAVVTALIDERAR